MTLRANEAKSRLDRQDATAGKTTGARRSRPKLWQVTSVDETAGTCTVRGLRMQDGSLETDETREKTGVLYDPDDPPNVGSRGHLKGLSGGQPFFFKKSGASMIRAPDVRVIKEVGDEENVGIKKYSTDPDGSWDTVWDTLYAAKFKSPVALPADGVVGLRSLADGIQQVDVDIDITNGEYTSFYAAFYLGIIVEDFSLPTLTRGDIGGLSRQTMTVEIRSPATGSYTAGNGLWDTRITTMNARLNTPLWRTGGSSPDISAPDAYGYCCFVEAAPYLDWTGDDATVRVDLNFSAQPTPSEFGLFLTNSFVTDGGMPEG